LDLQDSQTAFNVEHFRGTNVEVDARTIAAKAFLECHPMASSAMLLDTHRWIRSVQMSI
jgi:hypothetical protein